MNGKAGHKHTEVGVIPEEWDVAKLDDVSRIVDSLHQTPGFVGDGYAMVRVSDIKTGNLELSETLKVTKEVFETFTKTYRPRRNDIVLSRVGSYGVSSFVETDEPFCMGQNTVVIRPEIPPRLLYYLLNSQSTKRQIDDGSFGSGYKALSLKNIKSLVVPVPSTEAEQLAIAEALRDADLLLGALDELIAKKRDVKQAAMQQLLTGETRLPGFHDEWEERRLGDLAEMGSGGTPSSSVAAYYDGDIPWVSISDMTDAGKVIVTTERNLSRAGYENSAAQMFPIGTVLYAMYASLGECSIAGISLCTSQAILGIRPKENLYGEFLYYFLVSLKTVVRSLGQHGTQANLNKGMVQDFRLRLPRLPEQTAIAAVLSDMDAELRALEARRNKTRDLKQAMMQELLTGKTRLFPAGTAHA
jgi:type I restriction enzyme S subunit